MNAALKPKMRFLYDGICSLEEQVIMEVISQHQDVEAVDLSKYAECYSKSELEQYLKLLRGEAVPTYALPFNDHSEKLNDVVFFVGGVEGMYGADASFAELSVLGQVCALIGHRPDHYEVVVSAFASNYIKGALEAGATKEELKMILLRDRRLRGIDHDDESGMMERGYKKVLCDNAQGFVCEWDMDAHIIDEPEQRESQLRCMADLLLLPVYVDAREREVVLMHTTREKQAKDKGPVVAMDAFFSDRCTAKELEQSAKKCRYKVGFGYDWVCQLYKVSLTAVQGETEPVENFS